MPHALLMDNWTLQNAGELVCNGLDGDTASDLVFSPNGASFRYAEVSQDVIRFEALCQLLSNIVFADNLFVDAEYAYTWGGYAPLKTVLDQGILTPKSLRIVRHERQLSIDCSSELNTEPTTWCNA